MTLATDRAKGIFADAQDPAVDILAGRYYSRLSHLYGDCFYTGVLDYQDIIECRIRETADYVQEAGNLAAGDRWGGSSHWSRVWRAGRAA